MLFNKTRNKKIIEKVKLASSPWHKIKGLMFEEAKKFNYALVFELPKETKLQASIHMLFVFFPIDVVFLNKNKKVVDKVEGLQPFTPNYIPKKPSKFFIELPQGKAKNISLGDELDW